MTIDPGGLIGYHQATMPQLLLIVSGEGWVRGEGDQRHCVGVGTAIFWQQGEWHETGSDNGMTAIIIEADTMNPETFMPEKA